MGRTEITISRHWDHPQIRVDVTDENIGVSMPIEDFVKALKYELDIPGIKIQLKEIIGSVTFVLTKEEIAKRLSLAMDEINLGFRLDTAIGQVLKKMKEETSKVM